MSRKPKKPSEPVSAAYLFRKVANEKVDFETENGCKKVTRWEALIRSVQHQVLSNASAVQLLSRMRNKFPGKTACRGGPILVLTDNEMNY